MIQQLIGPRILVWCTLSVLACTGMFGCAEEGDGGFHMAAPPLPLIAHISDAPMTEVDGFVMFRRQSDGSAVAELSISRAPDFGIFIDLGSETSGLETLLNGQALAPDAVATYLLGDGREVIRPIESVTFEGQLEGSASLVLSLGSAQALSDPDVSPSAEMTVSGRLRVTCFCGSSASSNGDIFVSQCTDADSWCSERRQVLGLE